MLYLTIAFTAFALSFLFRAMPAAAAYRGGATRPAIGDTWDFGAAEALGYTHRGQNPKPRPDLQLARLCLSIQVDGQMATASLTQEFRNYSSVDRELDFLAPLPNGGAVQGLTLVVDGKELVGDVFEKAKALGIYERITRELKDPALIEYAGDGLFRARIYPIPAGGTSTLCLGMSFLLEKDNGRVALSFPLASPTNGNHMVEETEVTVTFRNVPGQGVIYSPIPGVRVSHDPEGATVAYGESRKLTLDRFVLYYHVGGEDKGLGGYVVSHKGEGEDGYFMFVAEPGPSKDTDLPPKTVICAIDSSGSMSGEKIRQARDAACSIVNMLDERDSFGLVSFDNDSKTHTKGVLPMTKENRKLVLRAIGTLRAGGSTFLSGGVEAALRLLPKEGPSYLALLTDGMPTHGVTDEGGLSRLVRSKDPEGRLRVFSFGVGDAVDSRLLDRFSSLSGGTSVYVATGEDIEFKVTSFFEKLGSPVLGRPSFSSTAAVSLLAPARLPDVFTGNQLVITGRYAEGGEAEFALKGMEGDQERAHVFKVALEAGETPAGPFVSRLWAKRRIALILDQLDLNEGPGATEAGRLELTKELLGLSKRYGVLTPYTSFLAAEDVDLNDEDGLRRTSERLTFLRETSGELAFSQRSIKASLSGGGVRACASMAPKKLFSLGRRMAPGKMMKLGGSGSGRARKGGEEGNGRDIEPVQLGDKTFFEKKGVLVEGSLTAEEIKSAKLVKKTGKPFYRLSKTIAPHNLVWLSQSKPIVFAHGGGVWKVKA